VLGSVGYRCGIFGKWHLGDEHEYQPDQRGFDEAFIHGAGGIGQAYDCSCADAPENKYFDPVIRHNGKFVKTSGFCTDVFFTAALGFIKEQADKEQPFFAYIATNAPHGPFIAPPKNEKRFLDMGFNEQEAGFYGMIENIDENMDQLLQKLTEWNLDRKTILIFMSDNGMTGGGSGRLNHIIGVDGENNVLYPFNAYTKGLKGSPDEGGVRVPFFVRWDGVLEPNRDIDRIAAHIDLLPTLAEIAGAMLPEGQVMGRSLWPLLQNPDYKWEDRMLFTHVARWPTGANPDDFQWQRFSVRNQRFRFVNNDQLYDMINDPGQTTNVIGKHPEIVERFRKEYDQFWKESRPLMVNEGVQMSPTRPFHVDYAAQLDKEGIPEWTPPNID
ncbi:MAG: sulfatase-like hydrolase/transferase, partial [Planctomycetaceae bacterium]|nr:sulfatase-like hydrolase/transferase [Planctomycetaceae bacterium]